MGSLDPASSRRGRVQPAVLTVVVMLLLVLASCTPGSGDGGDVRRSGASSPGSARTAPLVSIGPNPWPMHVIDGRFRGANALGPGDVNGDGLTDYVTNYEFDQRYVIAFHPPRGADPRQPWSTVDVRPSTIEPDRGVDSENAALADLDGDGYLDIAGAQGGHITPFFEGFEPGIRLMFGPGPARAEDASAWVDGGRIPATIEEGHFLWVLAEDVNGDGATDVLAGSRVLFSNSRTAGIVWIEAPADRAARRDLSRWTVHPIDPGQVGGHGFVLADIDHDGDKDLVHANADFDTPEDQESLGWYEHPDNGSPDAPWTRHELYRSPDFYGKPQVVVADLDGDGKEDILSHLPGYILWLRRTSESPLSFEPIRIEKDPTARWLARTIRVGDLDGDGRLDIIGMLTHDDGLVPTDHLAVFWMSRSGDDPASMKWSTHPVKFGSGKPMSLAAFGEKYDQADIADVDGDGDLDIVANIEEWWSGDGEELHLHDTSSPSTTSNAVVWFENTFMDAARRGDP